MENNISLSLIRHPYKDELTAVKAEYCFFPLNFNVYTDADNKERARARDKKQRRRLSWEEKRENYNVAAVRN